MTLEEVMNVAAAVIVSVGGGGAIVFALSSWLGKLWASRIPEQDRRRFAEELERLRSELEVATRALQARLDKAVFVHRVQFETEFKNLGTLCAALSRVRSALIGIRPEGSIEPRGMTLEEKRMQLVDRINLLGEALNGARGALDDHSPFYPAAVYAAAEAALFTARLEGTDATVDDRGRFTSEWYERGRNNADKFLAQVNSVSVLIRQRLADLAVYEGPSAE